MVKGVAGAQCPTPITSALTIMAHAEGILLQAPIALPFWVLCLPAGGEASDGPGAVLSQ